jgi:homoserine dehydrogenase
VTSPGNDSAHGSRVALLGFGTVGQSVARILCSGEVPNVHLTHIFNRNIARKRVDWVPPSVCWTESADEILQSDADIVIEVVGGLRPAYEWVRGALMAGKSVVTANKQLMAHHGPELLDLARSRGREVRFEPGIAWSKCAASSTARATTS